MGSGPRKLVKQLAQVFCFVFGNGGDYRPAVENVKQATTGINAKASEGSAKAHNGSSWPHAGPTHCRVLQWRAPRGGGSALKHE